MKSKDEIEKWNEEKQNLISSVNFHNGHSRKEPYMDTVLAPQGRGDVPARTQDIKRKMFYGPDIRSKSM